MQTQAKTDVAEVLTLTRTPRAAPAPAIPISESAARLLGTTAILAIAVIHILDAAGTYHSTRWIFWAYMVLIAASVPVALLLLHSTSPLVWGAAAGFAAGPLLSYLWSRSVGLPGDAPDIGNWLDTLGMSALFVESGLVALSVTRLVMRRHRRTSLTPA